MAEQEQPVIHFLSVHVRRSDREMNRLVRFAFDLHRKHKLPSSITYLFCIPYVLRIVWWQKVVLKDARTNPQFYERFM
jgi:hypothetical protein